MSEVLLEIEDVSCRIGGVTAVDGVNLSVGEDEIFGIVGPNGAGKTTLFNAVTGFVPYQTGDVRWEGRSIRGWKPHKIVRAGLSRTFQNAGGFGEMTVEQNLTLAGKGQANGQLVRVRDLLQLDRYWKWQVQQCSLATRKLVGIGIAAVQQPRMLLLDEPLSGLDVHDRDAVVDVIRLVREEGVTVMLIEHDIERALALTDRMMILDVGRKVAEGEPEDLAQKPELGNVYLRM